MNDEEARYVRMFVNWLYVHGPEPDSMPREKLIAAYEEFLNRDRRERARLWQESDPHNDIYEQSFCA